MKINYIRHSDTLHIELCGDEVTETRDIDENTRLDLDSEGRLCALTEALCDWVRLPRGPARP